MSPTGPSASAAPATTEADLFRMARRCLCGEMIIADPSCPGIEVAEHNASLAHLSWRWRTGRVIQGFTTPTGAVE